MRATTLASVSFWIIAAGIVGGLAFAGEPQVPGTAKPTPPPPPGEVTPEQAAMDNAAPGAAHAALAQLVGEWTTLTRFQPAPDAPSIESTGNATLTMTLDGRFMHDIWKGDMMGVPVTSTKTIGFNNATGKYETMWSYTMSTGMLFGVGTSADSGKTVQFQGSFDEGPQAGGPSSMFMTLKVVSDDEFSWEISNTAPGMEQRGPVMVTGYTRKK